MNKINQNKITFTLILASITLIFSSLTILCLPVLFNYKSKVPVIEKKFYENFKIYIKSNGKITYKPFPKPHLLVENASLNLTTTEQKKDLLNSEKLKIFISLRDIYLRSFNNFISVEISDSNLDLSISEIKEFRKHMYEKVNKPIIFNNCKIFIKNRNNEVILISPIKKILYKINNKAKVKNLLINGELFGLKFKSEWKRNYLSPKTSLHNVSIIDPIIDITNIFEINDDKQFKIKSDINYARNKLKYNFQYNNNKIKISSPNTNKTNFDLDTTIKLNPFFLEGELIIKNKKILNIIDTILLNLTFYDKSYLGNLNGNLKIKFDEIKNKLIKKGEFEVNIKEKKINIENAKFQLDKIGHIDTKISFHEDKGDVSFTFKNKLLIQDHIEFARIFQISSKKIKNIKIIYFDIIKNFGQSDFIIKNVKINNFENNEKSNEIYFVKNIQNLRSHIRNVVD